MHACRASYGRRSDKNVSGIIGMWLFCSEAESHLLLWFPVQYSTLPVAETFGFSISFPVSMYNLHEVGGGGWYVWAACGTGTGVECKDWREV